MKKREQGQGLVEYAVILVLVAVVVIVVLAVAGSVIERNAKPANNEASLGKVLEFTTGWELVSSHSHAFQFTGPFTTYICRNTDTHEYRECIPKVRDE